MPTSAGLYNDLSVQVAWNPGNMYRFYIHLQSEDKK